LDHVSHSSALQPTEAGRQRVRQVVLQFALRTVMALTDLPVATFTFVVTVTLVSTSVGLIAAFLVGIPLLILTGMIARALANFERARIRLFLDIDIPQLPGRPRGIKGALTDGPTWRAILYPLLHFDAGLAQPYPLTSCRPWRTHGYGSTHGVVDGRGWCRDRRHRRRNNVRTHDCGGSVGEGIARCQRRPTSEACRRT
jgi:hypothetical protein